MHYTGQHRQEISLKDFRDQTCKKCHLSHPKSNSWKKLDCQLCHEKEMAPAHFHGRAKSTKGDNGLTAKMENGDCLQCHDGNNHDTEEIKMERYELQGFFEAKLEKGKPIPKECVKCHKKDYFFKSMELEICFKCHDRNPEVTHRAHHKDRYRKVLREKPKDSCRDCKSCHYKHGWNSFEKVCLN